MPRFLEITRASQRKTKPERINTGLANWRAGYVELYESATHVGELVRQALRGGTANPDDLIDAASDIWHEEIYQPEVRIDPGMGYDPMRPHDATLQGKPAWMITDEDAVRLYDDHHEASLIDAEGKEPWEERYAREPIR